RFRMPDRCPVCGADVDHPPGEAMSRCTNAACPAQVTERLRHFASRAAMDVEGLGDVLAEQLTESGAVRDVADIYALDMHRLLQLPRLAEKSAGNVLKSIDRSKKRGLAPLLHGLGIRFVGEQTSRILAGDFGSLDAIARASEDELQRSEGIGPEVAASVALFFRQAANRDVVEKLRAAGVEMTAPKTSRRDDGKL